MPTGLFFTLHCECRTLAGGVFSHFITTRVLSSSDRLTLTRRLGAVSSSSAVSDGQHVVDGRPEQRGHAIIRARFDALLAGEDEVSCSPRFLQSVADGGCCVRQLLVETGQHFEVGNVHLASWVAVAVPLLAEDHGDLRAGAGCIDC